MRHDDKAFMANFVAILGALVALAIIIFFIAHKYEQPAGNDEASTLERIKPVGEVVVAGTDAAAKLMAETQSMSQAAPSAMAAAGSPGKEIYDVTCMACHGSGVAGAPKFGDKEAWSARFNEQGLEQIYQVAINGKGGMPPKGGRTDLADDKFKIAVNYLLGAAGLGPDAGKADPATPSMPAAAPQAEAMPVPAAESPASASPTPAMPAVSDAGLARGKEVFETTCMACHGSGVAGAPKFGDKPAWAERLKNGMEAVYQFALHGKGGMPPKGGRVDLSDEDIKHTVDYMVHAVR